jgi:hypothetical protein
LVGLSTSDSSSHQILNQIIVQDSTIEATNFGICGLGMSYSLASSTQHIGTIMVANSYLALTHADSQTFATGIGIGVGTENSTQSIDSILVTESQLSLNDVTVGIRAAETWDSSFQRIRQIEVKSNSRIEIARPFGIGGGQFADQSRFDMAAIDIEDSVIEVNVSNHAIGAGLVIGSSIVTLDRITVSNSVLNGSAPLGGSCLRGDRRHWTPQGSHYRSRKLNTRS